MKSQCLRGPPLTRWFCSLVRAGATPFIAAPLPGVIVCISLRWTMMERNAGDAFTDFTVSGRRRTKVKSRSLGGLSAQKKYLPLWTCSGLDALAIPN